MQAMILANTFAERCHHLNILLPIYEAEVVNILRLFATKAVTFRLLESTLGQFLPTLSPDVMDMIGDGMASRGGTSTGTSDNSSTASNGKKKGPAKSAKSKQLQQAIGVKTHSSRNNKDTVDVTDTAHKDELMMEEEVFAKRMRLSECSQLEQCKRIASVMEISLSDVCMRVKQWHDESPALGMCV